jgi:hypothetical protein
MLNIQQAEEDDVPGHVGREDLTQSQATERIYAAVCRAVALFSVIISPWVALVHMNVSADLVG